MGMAQQQSFGGHRGSMAASRQSMGARQSMSSVAPASRHSFAASQQSMGHDRQQGYDRQQASMGPGAGSMHQSMHADRGSTGMGQQRTSYNIGSRMPRASSSAVTTTTVRSHDETQALI